MTYPQFKYHGYCYYKIRSETRYIAVEERHEMHISTYEPRIEINDCEQLVAIVVGDGMTITENQFIDAYVRAIHDIQMEVYPQGMQVINEPAY